MTRDSRKRAVVIGGGTGQPQVLRCLLDMGYETTAVVTMADDGGSSGVLRRELGMLPPGDVRNCLVAMADDEHSMLAQVFQYRFATGEGLAGHALGNLIIAALVDIAGDFPSAIAIAERSLGARGSVYPSTTVDVALHGVDRTGAEISGQASLARNLEPVDHVFLEPTNPDAYPPVLEAIRQASVVVVGPGSLYTSIIPNFLVAGVADAMRDSQALRIYVCNVANMRGETGGLDAAEHVKALLDHGLSGAIDVALLHDAEQKTGAATNQHPAIEPVVAGAGVVARIESYGVSVFKADLADPEDPARHSRSALREALEQVIG